MDKMLLEMIGDPEQLKELINGVKPALRVIGSEFLSLIMELNKQDAYFSACALHAKKTYDAYLEVGFSEEQAFNLMMKKFINMRNSLQNIKVKS